MKNKELFDKTVSILVNAYHKDKLIHGDCSACAVGNIIAANAGIENNHSLSEWRQVFDIDRSHNPLLWSTVFNTCSDNGHQVFYHDNYNKCDKTRYQIDLTGYSLLDLANIEFSFETADQGENEEEYMFNGLMKVVDALMYIHEANETEVSQAKQLFVKETV